MLGWCRLWTNWTWWRCKGSAREIPLMSTRSESNLKLPKLIKTKAQLINSNKRKLILHPKFQPVIWRKKTTNCQAGWLKDHTYTLTLLNGGCHHGPDIVILEFFLKANFFLTNWNWFNAALPVVGELVGIMWYIFLLHIRDIRKVGGKDSTSAPDFGHTQGEIFQKKPAKTKVH